MSHKALFSMVLLSSVVFLGGMTFSGTSLAQSADNSTKMNKQEMTPGGVNADQNNNNIHNQQYFSPGGVNAGQQNMNKQDTGYMSPAGVTADQQGESVQDRELTEKIRQAVINDKDLSMNARNVRILTVDGVVTLKGPVASEQEKKAVEELATQLAGKDNMKSEINIVP